MGRAWVQSVQAGEGRRGKPAAAGAGEGAAPPLQHGAGQPPNLGKTTSMHKREERREERFPPLYLSG